MVFISIIVSFGLGSVVWMFLLRGFIGPWIKSRKKGYLLRVHCRDGRTVFCHGKPRPDGFCEYFINSKDDKRVFIPVEGCVVRCLRVPMIDVSDNETAPFSFVKVQPVVINGVASVDPVTGEVPLGSDGQPLVVQRKVLQLFEGLDDSNLIENLMVRAIQKPKISFGNKMGFPGLGIILVVVGIIVVGFIAVNMGLIPGIGGGAAVGGANTIG
jgi:hypothetical protein